MVLCSSSAGNKQVCFPKFLFVIPWLNIVGKKKSAISGSIIKAIEAMSDNPVSLKY